MADDGKEVEGKKEEARKPMMTATAPPLQPLLPHFMVEGDVRQSVLRCVEHFLSRPYLEGDPILVSQMNTELYVPLQLLVNTKLVPVFGELDLNLVITAIQESKEVSLDETHTLVKPNFKLSRATIILRELVGVTEDDVRTLFKSDAVEFSPTTVVKEIGDNWFVTFANEQEAFDALSFIRKQKHNDKPILARLKQESLLRTSYVAPLPIPSISSSVPSPWESFNPFEQGDVLDSQWDHSEEKDLARRGQKGDRRGNRPYQRKGREVGSNGDEKRTNETRSRGNRRDTGRGPSGPNSIGNIGSGGRKTGNNLSSKKSSSSGSSAPLNLGPANFPPLQSEKSPHAESAEAPVYQPQPARTLLSDYRSVVSSKAAPPPGKVTPKQEPVKQEIPIIKKEAPSTKDTKEKHSNKDGKDISSEFNVPRRRRKQGWSASSQNSNLEHSTSQEQKLEKLSQEKLEAKSEVNYGDVPNASGKSLGNPETPHAPDSIQDILLSDDQAQPKSELSFNLNSPASSSSSSVDSHPKQLVDAEASGHQAVQLSAEQKKMSWASLASKPPVHKS